MAGKLFGAEVPAPPGATKLGGTTEATLARLLSASHRVVRGAASVRHQLHAGRGAGLLPEV